MSSASGLSGRDQPGPLSRLLRRTSSMLGTMTFPCAFQPWHSIICHVALPRSHIPRRSKLLELGFSDPSGNLIQFSPIFIFSDPLLLRVQKIYIRLYKQLVLSRLLCITQCVFLLCLPFMTLIIFQSFGRVMRAPIFVMLIQPVLVFSLYRW